MDTATALKTVSKAIAGALVAALVALAARYGFNTDETVRDALEVIVTALIAAVTGFVGVYLAPKNKEVK
jgi:hypothetical protein